MHLAGEFKPGDKIEAQTSPIEHAVSISALQTPAPEVSASASQVIQSELVKIEGQYYVLRSADGEEVRLHTSDPTKLAGQFKPGDRIEAQISPSSTRPSSRQKNNGPG